MLFAVSVVYLARADKNIYTIVNLIEPIFKSAAKLNIRVSHSVRGENFM